MPKRKTVGEQTLIARSDTTRHDPMEVAEQEVQDLNKEFLICLEKSMKQFDEEEFCIVLQRNVTDPLIAGVRRNKIYGWLWLPQPRPFQTVFYYHKPTQSCKRLWSLPDPHSMAIVNSLPWVSKERELVKSWVDAFYRHDFHEFVRKQSNISMLTQAEYLDIHQEEIVEARGKNVDGVLSDSFDFSKVFSDKVINPVESTLN